ILARAVEETARVIDAAAVTPRQLSGLFLVGGSSRVPLVAQMLHQRLSIAPTTLEQPELPVAEGSLSVTRRPQAPGRSFGPPYA
ncbi:MAG: Hsp70 family protein, partial [Stackebrandtia sp.]